MSLRIRQGLAQTAIRLDEATMFEQGAGLFNFKEAYKQFHTSIKPKVTLFPSELELTENNMYTYPYSIQPIYHDSFPMILNLTIHNSLSMACEVSKIEWNTGSTLKDLVEVSRVCLCTASRILYMLLPFLSPIPETTHC